MGVAVFLQEYGVLRWVAVAAFGVAAMIVLARLAAVRASVEVVGGGTRSTDRESDAAHLMMCLVMVAMLVFPATADPHAVRGVLTAMTVVYGTLLLGRIVQWRNAVRMPGAGVAAFGYHVLAAAAMWYAMSGHGAHGHSGGPAPGVMLALAGVFAVDAVVMAVPGARRALRHLFPHPVGAGPLAVVPHVVMDLGTALMLVAVAIG